MAANREKLRGMILGLKAGGFTAAQVTRCLAVNRKTVDLWFKRDEEEDNTSIDDRPRSGRPRKTTQEQDRAIHQKARGNPFISSIQIRNELQLPVCSRTVRVRLRAAGLKCRTPAKKDVLKPAHKEARMRFAAEHIEKGLDFWGRVIFTDEKTFSSMSHGRLRCWRENNTR